MCAEVNRLHHSAGKISVDIFWKIQHMVHGAQLLLAVREFIHVLSRLKPEMLKHLKRCLRCQHIDIEHARVQNQIVRVVVLVDNNRQTYWLA